MILKLCIVVIVKLENVLQLQNFMPIEMAWNDLKFYLHWLLTHFSVDIGGLFLKSKFVFFK